MEASPRAGELPAPAPHRWNGWKRVAACAGLAGGSRGCFCLLTAPAAALPIAVALREDAGQLVIGWNAGVVAEGGRLEIQDGSDRTILMLAADTSSATYGLLGGDVEVRLTTDSRMGGAYWEAARFVTKTPRRPTESSALRGPDRRADAGSAEITPFAGGGAGAERGAGGEAGRSYTRTVNAFSARSTGRYSVSRSTGSRPASRIRRMSSPRRRFWLVVAPAS